MDFPQSGLLDDDELECPPSSAGDAADESDDEEVEEAEIARG